MAVAQHDGVDGSKIDGKRAGIVGQHKALAGIEQEAPAAGFDMEAESMFAARGSGGDGVVGQQGDADVAHGAFPPIQFSQTARMSSARGLAPVSTMARPWRWAAVAALS